MMMTAAEARTAAEAIKAHLNTANERIAAARMLLLDLYEREGWRALGYDSWRSCAVEEFSQSQSYLYRQLDAAKTERLLLPSGVDFANGETSIPESHLRELAPLAAADPEAAREVYSEAKQNGTITARGLGLRIRHQYQEPKRASEFQQSVTARRAQLIAEQDEHVIRGMVRRLVKNEEFTALLRMDPERVYMACSNDLIDQFELLAKLFLEWSSKVAQADRRAG